MTEHTLNLDRLSVQELLTKNTIARAVNSGVLVSHCAPKHVVGLSGGKDSTALALWLMQNEPRDYEFICNETGDELPDMQAHWGLLERVLGRPLKRVRHSTDLLGLIEEMQMLPNFRARWCTRILKIEPTIAYMEALPQGSILYVGLRSDEEERKGLFGEDLIVRFPLREYGIDLRGVKKILTDNNIVIPARTDCGFCFHQRIIEWCNLWRDYPDRWLKGVDVEHRHGHTFRSPGRDTWPVDMKSLGEAFATGRKIRGEDKLTEVCRVCSL